MINNELYHKLLYFYFQEYIFSLPEYEREKYIKESLFWRFRAIVVTLFLTLKDRLTRKTFIETKPLYRGNWIFVFGKNNYDATSFFGEDSFVFVSDRKRGFSNSDKIIQLPFRIKLGHYFRFIPLYLYLLRIEGKKTHKLANIIFDSIGWMEAFDEVIKKFKPKSIIFSNDHSYVPRALLLMAKKNNVPTIYIQHATVTSSFPPLEFDLSLLDGQDAFDKYSAKAVVKNAKFIGMPRFDEFFSKRKKPHRGEIKTVGFAFNTVDSLDIIYETIAGLIQVLPIKKIVVRQHPKDKRDLKALLHKAGGSIIFSEPLSEGSFEFLLNCDLLIAGDSAIHLDACMLNVQSYYFNFSLDSKIKDLYGFLRRGFVKELVTLNDLVNHIKNGLNGDDSYLRAKYYNQLIGTDMEQQASKLARDEVRSFLDSKLP